MRSAERRGERGKPTCTAGLHSKPAAQIGCAWIETAALPGNGLRSAVYPLCVKVCGGVICGIFR